jgi:hypothetical protein
LIFSAAQRASACAHHAFEDHVPVHVFQGYHVGYNADAAKGTIKTVLAALKNER